MILDALEKAFGSLVCPSPAELRQALASLPLSMETITPHIPQPSDLPYGRKVLFATPHVEIVLIHLPPDRESLPHNHGNSCGWECVLQGELTNVIYSCLETDKALENEVTIARCTGIKQGEFHFVASGEIHSIRNDGHVPVISLNTYTPPLVDCQQYRIIEA